MKKTRNATELDIYYKFDKEKLEVIQNYVPKNLLDVDNAYIGARNKEIKQSLPSSSTSFSAPTIRSFSTLSVRRNMWGSTQRIHTLAYRLPLRLLLR